jgi:ribonuclease R
MSKKKKKDRGFQGKILSIFKNNPNQSFNHKQIASRLDVKDTKIRNAIIKSLGKLCSQKILKQSAPGKFNLLIDKKNYKEGIIEVNSSGNGYLLMPEGENDIFVARKNIGRAFNGDLVVVNEFNRKKSGRNEGEIVEIIERKNQNFIGILDRKKDFGFVNTRGNKIHTDFFIESKELKDFKDGDKVIVDFKDWPKKASSPFGRIIKSLGQPGELSTEMHAIMHDYSFPEDFPLHVINYTQRISKKIDKNQISARRDFRKKTTFTIDPVTAKDFDDAISFAPLAGNKTEIGIHIADVSHYVKPNSILDEEAYERATSVYLVDRVVPMLPELLSNGVCSLSPREEKFTFSAVFVLNDKMVIEEEWFGKTLIYSDHRFSYEEVQFILDSEDKRVTADVSLSGQSYSVSEEIYSALLKLNSYAKFLREKRMKKGALSFDKVEVKFDLDEHDNPNSIYFKTSKDANKLVEELMLLANRRVAEFIGKSKQKKPFVYRVHDLPDESKLTNLQNVAKNLGYQLDLNSNEINKSLNILLQESHGKSEQQLIDTLTIRAMSKAVYTTDNIGHYGLAFEHYTHFTSPIRRYPDVLVHRLLESYINGHNNFNKEALEEACIHSSSREQLATKAERDSIKYMQVKFMEDKIDQRFEGVISGVTDRGIYVEILENKCEGFIKISEIKGDYFFHDEQTHSLIGQKTKKYYQLGSLVNIIVKKTDLLKKQLDFILSETLE